jgi:putative ABC transport system permease protein
MIISLAALVLSVCLAEISLPFLKDLIGKPLAINYSDPGVLTFILIAGVVVGLVSGLYPALYLSKFNPIQALSKNLKKGRSQFSFRQVLVGFQFFTCLGLMTVTLIVFKQFKHMQELDKGLNDQQVISIPLSDVGLQKNFKAFEAQLNRNPAIETVTATSGSIFRASGKLFVEPEGTKGDQPVTYMGVDKHFVVNMEIDLLEGSNFDLNNDAQNKLKILINKAAQD